MDYNNSTFKQKLRQMSNNLINTECQIHKKICEYICVYSKCDKRLICQKCRAEHLDIHPAQFIYELANLTEIHSYNKVDKLKEILIKEKMAQEAIIRDIYGEFQTLTNPLIQKLKIFQKESRAHIQAQLAEYLRSNKFIIDETEREVEKSDTNKVRSNPNVMLQQTIKQAQIINRRENLLVQNGQSYKWYSDTTKQMITGVILEIKSMMKVVIKLINNSFALQIDKYSSKINRNEDHHEMSFMKRYHASNEVAVDRMKLQSDILNHKRNLQYKDNTIVKNKKEIRDKVIKISELEEKIEGITEELQAWEQKKQREEREIMMALEKQRRLKEEMLIKNGVIGSNGKSLCFQRKQIDQKTFPLILELVPYPIVLDISNHKLTQDQLQLLLGRNSIQTLKYNFSKVQQKMIFKFLRAYSNLKHLQLNSCQISDDMLYNISKYFTPRLKVLYLIDNHISDDGLEQMFSGITLYLQELYISYNKISHKGIEVLNKHAHQLKVLHISKTFIRQKGGIFIGRYMKQLQQLFIGSTGMTKDGFLSICRNCVKLRRLSVVANEISTQVVTQILLGLKDLQWLDLSYCNLTKSDIEKIEKLKIFNKDLIIIFGI